MASKAKAKKPAATKRAAKNAVKKPAKKGKKKPHVVLFIPDADERTAPVPRRRVLAWPALGRSASRSGSSPVRLAPPVRQDWKVRLRAPAGTAPVISEDGALYVADRDGELRALDAETGGKVFSMRTDPILGASPAWPLVSQGVVRGIL